MILGPRSCRCFKAATVGLDRFWPGDEVAAFGCRGVEWSSSVESESASVRQVVGVRTLHALSRSAGVSGLE